MLVSLVSETIPSDVVGDEVSTVLLATIVSLFIPLFVNLVTKKTASSGLKSVVSLVAVCLDSVVFLWINPGDTVITWQLAVNTFLAAFVANFAAYQGIWKPTGVSGTVVNATPNFGLDSPPVLETADKGAEEAGEVDNAPRQ